MLRKLQSVYEQKLNLIDRNSAEKKRRHESIFKDNRNKNIWDLFCFTDENGGFGCGGIGDATQDKPLSTGGKGGQIKIPPKKALLLTPYASNRMPNVLFKKSLFLSQLQKPRKTKLHTSYSYSLFSLFYLFLLFDEHFIHLQDFFL